jgi:hypothetical protein
MTTQNPRLTITLQPSLAAQLRRLSQLTGNSQSSLISELLDGSAPVFDRLIRVLTAAEGAKASLRGHLAMDMAEAQARVEKQLGLDLDALGDGLQPLLDEFEVIRRRRGKGLVAGARAHAQTFPATEPTPISNRGVRSDPTHTKNIAKTSRPARVKASKGSPKSTGVQS